jgi:hypothetical protein
VRRLLPVTTALAALIVAATAAPATAAPTVSESSAAAPVRSGTVTLRPEHRFSLVGFGWRGRTPDIVVRARGADGRWSRWAEVHTGGADGPDGGGGRRSAPVWTGSADRLQYRLHEAPRRLTARFVRVRGKATPRPLARGAGGAPAAPPIVPRSQWDPSGQCRPRSRPAYGQVKLAFVHHTVTLNDYGPEEAAGIVLGICRYHRNSNGWNDIGYNFLVDRFGTVYEGRAGGIDRPVLGAQAQGFNAQSTGISNIGNHEELPQSEAALQAIAELIRWKLPLEGAPTAGSVTVTSAGGASSRWPAGRAVTFDRISGHRDGNRTACPGAALYAQLPTLRAMVAGELAPSAVPDGQLALGADRASVSYGDLIRLDGTLTAAGSPLPGTPVGFNLAYRDGARTLPLAPVTTRDDGSFRLLLRARHNATVTARSSGLASQPVPLEVAAGLAAQLRSSAVAPGKTVVVAGEVRRASRARTRVVVRRFAGDGWVTVRRRRLARVRKGRFGTRFRQRRAGDYQVVVVSPTNRMNRGAVVRLPLRVG